jgi:hypothetical protein
MIARLVKCTLAGALVAAAVAVRALTAGHKALAAQAAAGHQSTAAVMAGGTVVTALLLAAVFFVTASAVAWARSARRARGAGQEGKRP